MAALKEKQSSPSPPPLKPVGKTNARRSSTEQPANEGSRNNSRERLNSGGGGASSSAENVASTISGVRPGSVREASKRLGNSIPTGGKRPSFGKATPPPKPKPPSATAKPTAPTPTPTPTPTPAAKEKPKQSSASSTSSSTSSLAAKLANSVGAKFGGGGSAPKSQSASSIAPQEKPSSATTKPQDESSRLSVSSAASSNLDFDLDSVLRPAGAKLEHKTANRAKAPKRRPPSNVFTKEAVSQNFTCYSLSSVRCVCTLIYVYKSLNSYIS